MGSSPDHIIFSYFFQYSIWMFFNVISNFWHSELANAIIPIKILSKQISYFNCLSLLSINNSRLYMREGCTVLCACSIVLVTTNKAISQSTSTTSFGTIMNRQGEKLMYRMNPTFCSKKHMMIDPCS